MPQYTTVTGSLEKYEKGTLSIIDDDPRYYCHSNVFEVAARAKPYEKVAVGKNLEYVVEAIRAEGDSGWCAAAHDEFVVVMDGEVTVTFMQIDPAQIAAGKDGTQALKGDPMGKRIGTIRLRRGHQALLPKGTGYRFSAKSASVMI